jgi:hypothetical protein
MIVEPSVIREDVVRLSKELYNGVEVVAGSFDEIREVERLKGVIESYVEGRVRVVDVPLLSRAGRLTRPRSRVRPPSFPVLAPAAAHSRTHMAGLPLF